MTLSREKLSRLRWRCRRGTREMDLLMERFLLAGYASLTAGEEAAFEHFLETPDPVMRDWITGKTVPENPEYRKIIQLMQSAPGE